MKMLQEDLGTLCICALRYAMGRRTYMPSVVTEICKRYLPEITDKDLHVMLEDCESQARAQNWGDSVIDKPTWISWHESVREEKEKR